MEPTHIEVRGARTHNLRGVDLRLPRNKLICLTGVSGSGKSTMAFDTLYAEGQRRYVESLSTYARQFIGQLNKPDADQITGLSPAVAIQQKAGGWNPRSTVGTVTGISDFLRVLWATCGVQHCPACAGAVEAMSREQMMERLSGLGEGAVVTVSVPVVRGQKGTFVDLFGDLLRRGFLRARVDGQMCDLSRVAPLKKNQKHDIALVIDRLRIGSGSRQRLMEALDTGLANGDGTLEVEVEGQSERMVLSSTSFCVRHPEERFTPISVQMLSFNSPQGACPACDGLGELHDFDEDLLIPDRSLPFCAPAVAAYRGAPGAWRRHVWEGVAAHVGFDLSLPWGELPAAGRRALLYGCGSDAVRFVWVNGQGKRTVYRDRWRGVIADLKDKLAAAKSEAGRKLYQQFMRVVRCPECSGDRLCRQARFVRWGGLGMADVSRMSIAEAAGWFEHAGAGLTGVHAKIAEEPLKEIRLRLRFLLDVGLDYLSLSRSAVSLSGGESQRIRLASQIGSGLSGVLYVLDEPSIGLHPRDNAAMIRSLRRLADAGNTVLVVEHDEETMRASDMIVDFGPGAGHRGGSVIAQGHASELEHVEGSLTAAYLTGRQRIEVPAARRPVGEAPVPAGRGEADVQSRSGRSRRGQKVRAATAAKAIRKAKQRTAAERLADAASVAGKKAGLGKGREGTKGSKSSKGARPAR